jgi:hypothetical protein
MAFKSMEYATPRYDDVIAKYNLEILNSPGDLQIENGDIALTKDGDLKLGDTVYNALFRLVEQWRYTSPSLNTLFALVYEMKRREGELDHQSGEAFPPFDIAKYPLVDETGIARVHQLNDEAAAAQLSSRAYAGSIVIILNSLLQRFRDDIDAPADEWEQTPPLVGSISVGALLSAAANSFRHEDEWAKSTSFTQRQRRSIKALQSALPIAKQLNLGAPRFWGRIMCIEVLDILGAGDFDELAAKYFSFAHRIALARNDSLRAKK